MCCAVIFEALHSIRHVLLHMHFLLDYAVIKYKALSSLR